MTTLNEAYGSADEGYEANFEPGPESASDYGAVFPTPSPASDNQADYAPGPYSGAGTPYSQPTPGGGYSVNWGTQNRAKSAGGSDMNWVTPYQKAGAAATQRGGISGGGISQGAAKPYATLQTSRTIFPKGMQWPKFAGPTWDEREIKKRTQKAAAPGLRSLEMKVQSAMARYYENPNVRRMVLRDTLAGYGIGASNIMAQAGQRAQAEYGQDYARMYSEAMGEYNRSLAKLEAQTAKTSMTKSFATEAGYDKYMKELASDAKQNI
jgi:hypothetical protein